MKLKPDWDEAIILEEKLGGYLLSETHPDGKAKARFFIGHGYDEQSLLLDLQKMPQSGTIEKEVETPHGTKFVVNCSTKAPSGANIRIRTVWILENGQTAPRLVTAYPVKQK